MWIPKRTTFERTSRGIKFVRRLEWIENAINEPIPEDEFSLVKLGVRRGDTVEDTRTGVSYIVTGSEYPPADDGTAAEELKVASTRRIVLIAAGVLLLALLAFLAWTYSRKPKVTEA